MTKTQKAEKDRAIEELRGLIKPGDIVWTVLDSVSRSGMSRIIRVVLLKTDDKGQCYTLHPNYLVGLATGTPHGRHNGRPTDGLKVGGCGMDMGFALVYALSGVLYPNGFTCIGKDARCPSNDHNNYRRSEHGGADDPYTGLHTSGEYALVHRWL